MGGEVAASRRLVATSKPLIAGKHDVEDNGVEVARLASSRRSSADSPSSAAHGDFVALGLEIEAQPFGQMLFVLDHRTRLITPSLGQFES